MTNWILSSAWLILMQTGKLTVHVTSDLVLMHALQKKANWNFNP